MTVEHAAKRAYSRLPERWPGNEWLHQTTSLAIDRLSSHSHGDLPRWMAAVAGLPRVETGLAVTDGVAELGMPVTDKSSLRRSLLELHPWRKGPIRLGGQEIQTEWRSDWKWNRIASHFDFSSQRVLDIGCGNGYFGYRMLEAGARLVVGIDPTLLFVMQWLACRHFAGDLPNYVLPLGIEDLPETTADFDVVCSMGVLYHRKDPLEHLHRLGSLVRSGGTVILESLVLPEGRDDEVLVPEGRYAAMRNVWALPGTERLREWLVNCGYSDIRRVDVTATSVQEQRSTDWMRFESLEQALDPDDHRLTREGHPAPRRAVFLAKYSG